MKKENLKRKKTKNKTKIKNRQIKKCGLCLKVNRESMFYGKTVAINFVIL